jgi:hypothetical protein
MGWMFVLHKVHPLKYHVHAEIRGSGGSGAEQMLWVPTAAIIPVRHTSVANLSLAHLNVRVVDV